MISSLRDADKIHLAPVARTYTIAHKRVTFESARLALLAHGSAIIRDEDGNYLLTTVGIKETPNTTVDYFPLLVEYQEKYYATGKIGGNRFARREGRPSDTAVLNSRLIDRPIRPMFPKGVCNDVQIISTILSSSGTSDFGFYGITGASLALLLAGVEGFEGPVAGARLAFMPDGTFRFDPSIDDIKNAIFDLTVAGTPDAITMVELQGREADDKDILRAMEHAHAIIREICVAEMDFVRYYHDTHGVEKISLIISGRPDGLADKVKSVITSAHIDGLYRLSKTDFHHALMALGEEVVTAIGWTAESDIKRSHIDEEIYSVVKKHMRARVLDTQVRLDGRGLHEVRPVRSEVGVLPRTHGSGLFERGITQVLTVTTLGGPGDMQTVDDLFEEETKRYIHHYNFPPFSVGEVKMLRGVGRREIGHGRLAEKALEPVLPSLEEFPYFIRVVSETMTCNGSSSMASVCGSSLSLMDAGVPISGIVAGIAMGMIYDEASGRYEILTDIQAQEDFLGDLDFKVARTEKGITALQMDCKVHGLKISVIEEVFRHAREATASIRAEMVATIPTARTEISPYAPRILSIRIPVERIREVIGKGGEVIQKICRDFAVEVDITDEGIVTVTSKNQEHGDAAMGFIQKLLKNLEIGDQMIGKVIRIIDGTGAIIDLGHGKSGMIHISRIARERVNNITDYLNIGDEVEVRILTIDRESNKVGLQRIVVGQ